MREVTRRPVVMKVCHVAMGDLWAGAEVHLLALMKYLVRVPGFEWSVILFNEGKLADELRKLPVALTVIPEKDYGPVAIGYRLARVFRKSRPDIVHTHKYKDSILGSMAARCVGVPHVIRVVHGMPEPFKGLGNVKMGVYTIADWFVTSWLIDKVIAVSSDIERRLCQTHGENRVVCIHNGIDLEAIHVTIEKSEMRRQWHIDEKTTLIGTVGRLVPVKGQAILLEALRILRDSCHNITLLFVGDGPLRGHLQLVVQRLGLEQSVIFAGHQEKPYDFINMMDIFVLSSLHEGIPMVLLEALALKRSVIATRVGGIPEVVSHGLSGILVSPGNAGELAAGIKDLINDPSKAVVFGTVGRTQIEDDFNASVMANQTAAVYKSLCNS